MISILASLLAWIGAAGPPLPADAGTIDINKQIAPVINQFCASCHRPGEAAPFPLLTYEDVRKHAAQIVAVTQSRYMPPWLPAPGHGEFAGNRRLTETQLRLLARWSQEQGCTQGDPGDLPPAPALRRRMATGATRFDSADSQALSADAERDGCLSELHSPRPMCR